MESRTWKPHHAWHRRMHSDMLQSLKAAFFVGQKFDAIDPETAYLRFRNANHYVLNNGFRGSNGNDLVVLDYDHPTDIGKQNFTGHLLFGINASHVRDLIVEGKCIVRDRVIQTVDQEAVLGRSREVAGQLWKRMQDKSF
jgi:cytosine/adenosine deaminase-related metal-dependent hydrolase